MPEASVHEDSKLPPGEHDVGAQQPSGVRAKPVVDTEPEATPVKFRTKQALGTGISSAVGALVSAS